MTEQDQRETRERKGLIIVHTGNGKGKTTAALGMLLRAWGHGMRPCVIQFIKSRKGRWGEIKAAERLGIEWHRLGDGFVRRHGMARHSMARERSGLILGGWRPHSFWRGQRWGAGGVDCQDMGSRCHQDMGSRIEVQGPFSIVALPATCGELVQGTLDGAPRLVSCPIDWYAVATVRLRTGAEWDVPADAPKAVAALQAGLALRGREQVGGRLVIRSRIPRGRGYGSSTADVGATLYALGLALREPMTLAEAARLAVRVEPSDSTILPGLALFDHRGGDIYETWAPAPRMAVIVIDPGGQVDTIAYNRVDRREALLQLAPQHQEAFALLRQGLERGELASIGAAATLSSEAHQAILHNPLLERVQGLARAVHALGVCRAHSGTILGLLVDEAGSDVRSVAQFVARRLGSQVAVIGHSLVDGGPRILSCEG